MRTEMRASLALALALALAALSAGSFACARVARRSVILCAGDSLTELGYPSFLQGLLRRHRLPASVLNYGRKGFTSGEYLRFLQKNKARISALKPDLVLLMLGTNDVRLDGDRTATPEFVRNMRAVIDILRTFRGGTREPPIIVLATIPPVPPGAAYPFSADSARRVREEINPALSRMAAELGLPLVDQYSLFVGSPELLPDVHPSPLGYREMARKWLEAVEPRLRPRP
jgi:lysophospholipase L1-like esterase